MEGVDYRYPPLTAVELYIFIENGERELCGWLVLRAFEGRSQPAWLKLLAGLQCFSRRSDRFINYDYEVRLPLAQVKTENFMQPNRSDILSHFFSCCYPSK